MQLTGDFSSWDSHPIQMNRVDEGYEVKILLLRGMYEYKFKVNGRWKADPENPIKSAQYGNSILFNGVTFEDWSPVRWQKPELTYIRSECDFEYFRDIQLPLPIILGMYGMRKRPVYILLPPSYASTDKEFPVVYAIDGYNSFSTPKTGKFFDKYLDEQWRNNKIPEFIFVAIPSLDIAIPGTKHKDICFKEFSQAAKEPYVNLLTQVICPSIQSNFRASKNPKDSILLGDHFGGLMAFVVSLLHPELFGQAICLSPTFGYHDKMDCTVFDMMRLLKLQVSSRFYLDSSSLPNGSKNITNQMADTFSLKKLPASQYSYQHEIITGEMRNEDQHWSVRFGKGLQFILC